MKLTIYLPICVCLISLHRLTADESHKLVAYWGQNSVSHKHKDPQFWEKDLSVFCEEYDYDVINIAFLHEFFSAANKDGFPGLNFANHCTQPVSSDYPELLRCPNIERGIEKCQKRGKKVLLSLGGAKSKCGFKYEIEAIIFAYRVYHLFLGGDELKDLRPFGSAVLDGIDLDIESTDSTNNKYYTHFVKELRRLEKTGTSKMMITAAPQCPFPDKNLGPNVNKVLGDVPELIDEIYVQFYNNWCQTGNPKAFKMRFREWMGFTINHNGPVVYIGLPSDPKASGNGKHYRKHEEIKKLYKELKDTPKFGGIMLWDASFDQNSHQGGVGKRYSEYLKHMMIELDNGDNDSTTQQPGSTLQLTTLPATSAKTTATTSTGSVSCNGNRFGLFPHPHTCSQFIHCSHFVPYVKQCPGGLHFNAAIKVCDWPRSANCKL